MTDYTVAEIWRYPVKSMQGERLTRADVTAAGIRHDRSWAVRDEKTKTIRGAKHFSGLLNCHARFLDGAGIGGVPHVEITLPNGERIGSRDRRVHEALSDVVGRAVTLWPLLPADARRHYALNDANGNGGMAEWRRSFGLEDGEPFPDMSGFPKEMLAEFMAYATPRGTYFDAYPIDVLTEASLRKLATLCPGADLDVRRFRPNILLADSEDRVGFAEVEWVGRQLAVGRAELDVVVDAVRCVMVTCAQPGLGRDTAIMRTLVRETKQRLSVYADVVSPGEIRLGDPVRIGGKRGLSVPQVDRNGVQGGVGDDR